VTPPVRQIYPLIARPNAAREEFEVKDAFGTAVGGGLRPVLEFEFLSRKMVGEQSMEIWR
jgi:hypothetical protein